MATPIFNLPDIDDIVNIPCITLDSLAQVTNTGCSNLNCLHVNVRSLTKHWGLINVIIDSYLKFYDLIVFTEINIRFENSRFFNLNGFNKYTYCRENRRGGGVMIFVKEKIQSVQICLTMHQAEIVYIKLYLTDQIVHVCGIYRPPNLSVFNFIEEFEKLLE